MLLTSPGGSGRILPRLGLAVTALLLLLAARASSADEAATTPPPQPAARDEVKDASLESTGGEAGHGSASFRLGYYHNDDKGDGNPFLDEELTVIEPVVVASYNLTDRLTVNGTFSYDSVSSASIDRLSRYPQQSGASGDNYVGVNLGLSYKATDTLRFGGSGSFSTEYDYSSFGAAAFVARDVADKNATLKLDVNGFFDVVDVIRFNGTEEGKDDRLTLSTTFTWYQIIDPRMHSELGVVGSYQSGFLETAYNAVVVEDDALPPNPALDNNARGREITEELPGDRLRGAVFGRIRRHFDTGTALELGGRVYTDTWGLSSVAFEPAVFQWLVKDTLRLRFHYRYYIQTPVDDFKKHFTAERSKRTQDSDLGDFDAHTVGLRLDWHLSQSFIVDVGGDYLLRSDGLDQIFGSFGITWKF